MWRRMALLVTLAACSPPVSSATVAAGAEGTVADGSTATVAATTLPRSVEAGSITVEFPEAPPGGYARLAESIDPTGRTLAAAGIEAYRFVSTVEFHDRPRLTSRYEGVVSVESASTSLTSSGITGAFRYLSSPEGTWYQVGSQWYPVTEGMTFRWSPAGPIPNHFVASVIGRLALGSGEIRHLGTETLLGHEVSRLRRIQGDLWVDVLITADGLVLGVELRDELPHAVRFVRFLLAEVIEVFEVEPPL